MEALAPPAGKSSSPRSAKHGQAGLDAGAFEAGDTWRELRDDVRSLAQPMDPAFQARLEQELVRRGAMRARARRRLLRHHRLAALGGALAAAVALAAALVMATPRGSHAPSPVAQPAQRSPGVTSSPAAPALARAPRAGNTAEAAKAAPSVAASAAPATAGSPNAASAPGREQHLAASITLGTTAGEVQAISGQVSQLAVREGGYVQSSNVRFQQQGTSEATLSLRIPSAKLSAALASIGQLAAVRAENQSLEDITSSYDAAQRQLADALAERSALLRALAAATTEGQIDSLHERLTDAGAAIARAQAAVNAASQRASTAEVEVSVLATQRDADEGLTLRRGLHDAGRVLVVALIVILIACAVLVPLALVIGAFIGARSVWRHHQRERALGAP